MSQLISGTMGKSRLDAVADYDGHPTFVTAPTKLVSDWHNAAASDEMYVIRTPLVRQGYFLMAFFTWVTSELGAAIRPSGR